MNLSPREAYWSPAWQPKFTKATLPCKSGCGRAGNSSGVGTGMVLWQGSSRLIFLGREIKMVVRWGAQGAEQREGAGWKKPLGIAIWGRCHSETVCGGCMRWDKQEHRCLTPQAALQNYLLSLEGIFHFDIFLFVGSSAYLCVCVSFWKESQGFVEDCEWHVARWESPWLWGAWEARCGPKWPANAKNDLTGMDKQTRRQK